MMKPQKVLESIMCMNCHLNDIRMRCFVRRVKLRCSHINVLSFVFSFVLSWTAVLSCVSAKELSADELRENIERAVSEYIAYDSTQEFNVTLDYTTDTESRQTRRTIISGKQGFLKEEPLTAGDTGDITSKDGGIRVTGYNAKYSFNISGNAVSKDWRIDSVVKNKERFVLQNNLLRKDNDGPPYQARFREMILPFVVCGYFTLLDVVNNDNTILNSIEELPDGSVRSSFSMKDISESNPETLLHFSEGQVTLTPHYTVKESEVVIEPGYKQSIKNEYSGATDREILTRHTEISRSDGNEVLKYDLRIDVQSPVKAPRNRFYLSYYGLPEPKFDEDAVGLWRAFFVLVGGLAIVLSIFYKWKHQKKVTSL